MLLKYKLFLDFLIKNNMLNSKNRIKGCRNRPKELPRQLCLRIFNILEKLTSWLPEDTSSSARMRYVFNNISKKTDKCPVCQNRLKYSTKNMKFELTCGLKDSDHQNYIREETQRLAKESQFKKYGGWASQTEEVQKKIAQTNREKYGVDRYSQTDEFKQKMRQNKEEYQHKRIQTNLEKYGYEFASQHPEIKLKNIKRTKEAIQEKYGVDHFTKWKDYNKFLEENKPHMMSKMKQTNLEKYGAEYVPGSEYYKSLMVERYGVENYFQTEEYKNFMRENWPSIQEKIKKTNLEKYGVENYFQSKTFKDHLKENRPSISEKIKRSNCIDGGIELSKKFLINEFITEDGYFDLNKFMREYNCGDTTAYKIMREFDIKYKKRQGTSMAEEEIVKFIKEIDPDIIIETNTKQVIAPKELDIYLPEYNLAIEYNGLMFHSQGISEFSMFNTPTKNKKIHLEKTEACEEKGIQLLHIFENEWLDPNLKRIWKSVIRNKLRRNANRIMARKCQIRELTSKADLKLSSDFFKENHLQGAKALGRIRIGLFYEGELVSCMTFGQSRFHKEKVYELIRFANKQNTTVMGAASKLFKYFIRLKDPTKVISYANRRWSDGGLYRQLNFTELHKTEPNYYYFKPGGDTLWSRNVFQKHKLKDKLDIFDENLTESENMFNNGYRRIYDSGNYSFLWTK